MKSALIILVLLVSASVFAGGDPSVFGDPVYGHGEIIQGCNFDGTESVLLTVAGLTRDNTKYSCFSVYSPVDCKIRLMASSSKTGSVSEPIFAYQWNTVVANKKTPFANVSGCTGGIWRRNSASN